MGLCPIAPPKGFPSVYGACLAHRPLETFGRKYFVLLLKYRCYSLISPLRIRLLERPKALQQLLRANLHAEPLLRHLPQRPEERIRTLARLRERLQPAPHDRL